MNTFSLKARPVLTCAALVCVCGCPAPTRTQITGDTELRLAAAARIVVYPSIPCLSKFLEDKVSSPSIVMSTTEFQDALFPWFEPGREPQDATALDRLVAKPHVRARIDELEVRYLISLTETNASNEFPGLLCGGGYPIGGCFGLGWENKQTSLNALIWDFWDKQVVGTFSIETTGTSLAIGVWLPFIFTARTESEACREIANVIADNLENSSPR